MTQGPGKYDKDAMKILLRDKAVACAILVLGGVRKSGSALKVAVPPDAPEWAARQIMRDVAGILRAIANEIDKDAADPTLRADDSEPS